MVEAVATLPSLAVSPPDWVREWVVILGPALSAAGIIIPAMRRWLIKPVLDLMHEHADQHARWAREFAVNGSDSLLPESERGLPMRTLLIKNRVDFNQHSRETAPLVQQYITDLRERGQEVGHESA